MDRKWPCFLRMNKCPESSESLFLSLMYGIIILIYNMIISKQMPKLLKMKHFTNKRWHSYTGRAFFFLLFICAYNVWVISPPLGRAL
jgi:hypothetical protein